MKEERRTFVKRVVLFALILCLITCIFTACTKKNVESIEVDETSNAGYYMLEGFNISTLKLRVTYENGDVNTINVEKSMLTTSAQNELKSAGQKEITINYQGKTTTVSFYLAEEGEQVVEVTFKDISGNKLAVVKTLQGGSVEDKAPEVDDPEGQTFRGWVDSNDEIVDLSNVQSSMTVTAAFTTSTTKYTVRFYDYKGGLVSEVKVEEGGSVYAPTYNKPAELKSYTWNATFPIKVTSNISVQMSADYNYYSVDYAYAYESSRSDRQYINNLHEDVKYGETAKNLSAAQSRLPGTIAENTTESTTIYKNTTFLFILKSERVSVTVYNSEDLSLVKIDTKEYLVNSTFTFPDSSPVAVAGKTFAGWRLFDGSKYSDTFGAGATWKVNNTSFGSNVKVVPYYTTAFASVTFSFVFSDVKDENDRDYVYNKLVSNVFEIDRSEITYSDVATQLRIIKSTNGGNEVSDNTDAGKAAMKSVADSEITAVTYNGRPFTVDSSVKVQTTEMTFVIKLSTLAFGTKALEYAKVTALFDEPTLTLPAGDSVVEWKYDSYDIPCFPYVIEVSTWDYSLLKYKTTYVDSYITAPGYYQLNVPVGTDIPSSGWYTYNDSRALYVAATAGKTVSGTNYYGYYVPAGFVKADVTEGASVTPRTYYVYDTANHVFKFTDESIFAANKEYFTCNYKENTTEYNSGYFFGFAVNNVDLSLLEAGSNIYLPDFYKETVGEEEVSRPVVSVSDGVFATVNSQADLLALTEPAYVIASMPSRLIYVGQGAFVACQMYGLTDFGSVSYVSETAFAGAILEGDVSFASLKIMGNNAFSLLNLLSPKSVVSLTFSGDLKAVSEEAFAGACGKLSIAFNPTSLKRIENGAFADCAELQATTGFDAVKHVGAYAFDSTPLTALSFPNLETVGTGAFNNMENLTELRLGGNGTLTQSSIDLNLIEGSKNVTILIIGKQDGNVAQAAAGEEGEEWDENVTTVTNSISGDGYKLRKLGLPASLTTIDRSIFDGFTFIDEIVFPLAGEKFYTDQGVLYVKDDADYTTFYYPVNKMGAYVVGLPADAETLTIAPASFGNAEITVIDLTGISANISVRNEAFTGTIYGIKTASTDKITVQQLSAVAKVYLKNVTAEGAQQLVVRNDWNAEKVFSEDAFTYYFDQDNQLLFEYDPEEKTAALIKGYRYAKTITVPAAFTVNNVSYSVNEIKTRAFYGFEDLTELTVQARLYKFPENVFGDSTVSCGNLVTMSFAGWIDKMDENEIKKESFMYTAWYGDHTIIFAGNKPFGYNKDAADQEISAEELVASGFNTTIGAKFFENAVITSIAFPDSITMIEKSAFAGCANLVSVDFNKVTSIGDSAFAGCVKLTEANVPNLISLGQSAFMGCSELTEFNAPALTRMPVSAFEEDRKLEKVDLAKLQTFSVNASKQSRAFLNCASLTEISLPSYVADTLPSYVFYGCTSLKSYDFSVNTSITTIGTQAFYGCTALEYVLLGSSVVNIEESAFEGCTSLNVQIPYSIGGLYIANTHVDNSGNGYYEGKKTINGKVVNSIVYDNAFTVTDTVGGNPGARFFVSGDVDTTASFLSRHTAVQSTFPVVSFAFLPDSNVDYSKWNNNININDIGDRIYFTEEDLTALDLKADGLSFIAWYTQSAGGASYNEVSFPIVWTENVTVYAKYISDLRGTLDNDSDVSYIYLVEEEPELIIEENTEVRKYAERSMYDKILKVLNPNGTYFDGNGNLIIGNVSVAKNRLLEITSDPDSFLRTNGISDEWGESVVWHYRLNGVEVTETVQGVTKPVEISFPFVLHGLAYGDKVEIFAEVKASRYVYNAASNDNCIDVATVSNKVDFGDIGTFGYAIIKYSGTDSKNIILPDTYSDGDVNDNRAGETPKHGEAPIIALYAGAFGNEDLKATELKLPAGIRVLLKGYYNAGSYATDRLTFNSNIAKLDLPEALVYIEDGLFNGLSNLKTINFGDRSQLLYVSRDSFIGTEWYKKSVLAAEGGANSGFVMAGRTAIEYVGKTSSLFLKAGTTTYSVTDADPAFMPGLSFGWDLVDADQTTVASQTLKLLIYDADSVASEVITYAGNGGVFNSLSGLYTITMKAAANEDAYPYITFTVYGRAVDKRKAGDVMSIEIDNIGTRTDSCYRFITEDGDTVSLPSNAIKVADRILKANTDMITLFIGNELVYIGEEAFYGSSLTAVNYSDSSQNSKITYVGKNAFAETPWYTATESVIVGTVYLKYNNTGTGSSYGGNSRKNTVQIPAYVTRIAQDAFRNATGLGTVAFSGSALTVIEQNAFAGSGIITMILPSSVTEIKRGAFKNCASLTDVNLASTKITLLGQDLFFGCGVLASVTMPASTTEFGKNVFRRTTSKLTNITAPGAVSIDVEESAIIDTGFYSPEQQDVDTFIILGSILVKYVTGKINVTAARSGESEIAVVIPSDVKTVLKNAFKNNAYVTKVTFPSSVTLIGQSAFEGCSRLKSIVFESGSALEKIDACAFKDCNALISVSLPNMLKTIGAQAFYRTAITTVVKDADGKYLSDSGFTIPDTVNSIGTEAFYGVDTLTVLNLGPSLEVIDLGAFVTNYTTTSNNEVKGKFYRVNWNVSDVDIESDMNEPFVKLTTYMNRLSRGDLTAIFATNDAFVLRFYFPKQLIDGYIENNTVFWNKTNENMPYICKEIDNEESLPKITLRYDGSSKEIYLERIADINDLLVPTSANKTFVEWVIGETDAGEAIAYPYDVRTNSLSLTAKFITNNVESSSEYTVSVISESECAITEVKSGVKTLYVPATYAGKKVTSIELTAENNEVETIVFTKAENFKGFTTNVFEKYKALKKILIPNDANATDFTVENITIDKIEGEGEEARTVHYSYQVVYAAQRSKLIAFIGTAESDMEFVVPDNVNRICASAFINSGLSSLFIPASVSQIDQKALNAELTKVKIEKGINIKTMTYAAFASIEDGSLWSKTAVSSGNDDKNSYSGKEYVEIKGFKYSKLKDDVLEGYYFAFANILLGYSHVSGTDMEMPGTINNFDITVLASNVFNVKNAAPVSVNNLTLPSKISKINSSAFVNLDVTGGIVEKSVTGNTFTSDYAQLNDIADGVFSNLSFYKNANSSMLVLGKVLVKATYMTNTISVPEGIETIMENAFDSTQAQNITLPNGLKKIGAGAFYSASKLESITIPNSVTDIGDEAFRQCTKLSLVKFDTINSSLSTLGNAVFAQCTALRTIRLPANLKKIGDSAFSGCKALEEITFNGAEEEVSTTRESGLTAIGQSAFKDCSKLVSIIIPDGVTEIKSATFHNCSNLEEIIFNESTSKLSVIGASAFMGCVKLGSKLVITGDDDTGYNTDLVTLRMPNSLTRVEESAFSGCVGLWGILFNYNIDYLGDNVFAGCNNLVKVVFYRDTPPTVSTNTFETGDSALYRLRIYVRPSRSAASDNENYGSTMENYINKWTEASVTCNGQNVKFSIYEREDLPTLYVKDTVNASTATTIEGVEYYIMRETPTNEAKTMRYVKITQKESSWYYGETSNYPDVVANDSNRNSTNSGVVYNYGNQYIEQEAAMYVILIVDYDEMTVAKKAQ